MINYNNSKQNFDYKKYMYKSIKNVYCRKNGNNSPTNKADPLF